MVSGIRGSLWRWFNAYLTNRKQCVRIKESTSEVLPVLSGVPQGSILGPLLFILYVIDLPLLLKAMLPFIFADDTKCLHAAKTNTDFTAIQEDLNMGPRNVDYPLIVAKVLLYTSGVTIKPQPSTCSITTTLRLGTQLRTLEL